MNLNKYNIGDLIYNRNSNDTFMIIKIININDLNVPIHVYKVSSPSLKERHEHYYNEKHLISLIEQKYIEIIPVKKYA